MNGTILQDGRSAPASAADVAAALTAGQFFWLDLDDEGARDAPEITDLLTNTFHFHALAVESAVQGAQRARIDSYEDFVHVVTYGMASDGGSVSEVHAFLTDHSFVTVHDGANPALDTARQRFASRPTTGAPPVVALYMVMDTLVDTFFPALADFDDAIDDLAAAILKSPTEEQLGTIFAMKRQVMAIRRAVSPQRDMISSLTGGMVDLPGWTDAGAAYFRNLYDHLIRISDMVDGYRDLLSGVMDTHLSMVSNRLNVVMKQLAVIATVFLPLGFLTGFFGQNFAWLQAHAQASMWNFLGWGIGPEVVAIAILMLLFRRRGWLGSGPTA